MATASGVGRAPIGDPANWDTRYEFRAVLLLTLAFGLVGLDRWILPPLFAAQMGADLGLTPKDPGNLVGALGIALGVSAIFMGGQLLGVVLSLFFQETAPRLAKAA